MVYVTVDGIPKMPWFIVVRMSCPILRAWSATIKLAAEPRRMKLPARVQTHEMNIQLFREMIPGVIEFWMYPLISRMSGTLEITLEKRMIMKAKSAVQSWVGSSRQAENVARKKSSG